MRIISMKKLRDFWAAHPDAEGALRSWAGVAREADWRRFADIRQTYNHADQVGRYIVFNVGGNKFRLIAAIHFNTGLLYVRHVLTHADYDTGAWKQG